MWEYNDSYLTHYGKLGMKWGKISERLDDHSTRRSLKRQVSADKRLLKVQGRLAANSQMGYKQVSRDYSYELTRPIYSTKQSLYNLHKQSQRLTDIGKQVSVVKANYLRANKIYEEDTRAYLKHLTNMDKKYGSNRVSNIQTKTIYIGDAFTKDVIKTYVTAAELPVIGRYVTAKLAGGRDYEERTKQIDAESSKRY